MNLFRKYRKLWGMPMMEQSSEAINDYMLIMLYELFKMSEEEVIQGIHI